MGVTSPSDCPSSGEERGERDHCNCCVYFRFVFIPLFLYCNIRPDDRNLTSVAFESDTAYIIIMMLFSVSNGYVSSICMISGPQMVTGEEAGTAANLMVACLGLGLGVGAFLSNFFAMLI